MWLDSKSGGATAKSAEDELDWLLEAEEAIHSPFSPPLLLPPLSKDEGAVSLCEPDPPPPVIWILAGCVSPIKPGSLDLMEALNPL